MLPWQDCPQPYILGGSLSGQCLLGSLSEFCIASREGEAGSEDAREDWSMRRSITASLACWVLRLLHVTPKHRNRQGVSPHVPTAGL